MSKTKGDQSGFGVIGIVLIIVTIALIGTAGWLVYKDHHKTINSYQACAAKYPVQQSYPTVCSVPGGKSFTNPTEKLVYPSP